MVKVCYPVTRDGDDGEQCVHWSKELYSYYLAARIDPSR